MVLAGARLGQAIRRDERHLFLPVAVYRGTLSAWITHREAGADVLLDAVLREGIAQAVLGERLHAGDRLGEVVGRQGHQHFVVEHPAIAALGKARDRQARLAGFKRAAPGIGAGRTRRPRSSRSACSRPIAAR